MTFLPIVGRELRVAARRRGTYWVRALAALGAILVGCFVYLMNSRGTQQAFGTDLFNGLSGLSMLYCVTAGVRVTADCLSAEKREGTLGLLFLTDLKGYDVVFGKLVATSLNAFYGLLAIFPVMAVPLLLGGITNGELWRVVLVLVNTFLFSLAAGIFISAISHFPRKAMAGTFFLLLFFVGVIPLCALWLPKLRDQKWAEHFYLTTPLFSFGLSDDVQYRGHLKEFWWSVGVAHGLTWIFLILACVAVPRSWQDKPAGVRSRRWRDWWHQWSFGDDEERRSFRRRLLDINAFYWLAGRARLKPLHVWGALGVVACFWAWGCLEWRSDWFNEAVYIITALVLNSLLKCWVASEAGRRLGEDRKAGALELLLSTPLTVEDILRGQLLALQRQFLWPILAVVGIEITFLLSSLQRDGHDPELLGLWVAGIIMLVADVIALPWVGMWVALSTRSPNRATGITVARLLVFPWLAFVAIMIVVGVVNYAASADPGWKFVLGLWFGLGIVTDIVMATSAWRHLHTQFRLRAMERFTPPRPWWTRLFRGRTTSSAPNLPPVVAS